MSLGWLIGKGWLWGRKAPQQPAKTVGKGRLVARASDKKGDPPTQDDGKRKPPEPEFEDPMATAASGKKGKGAGGKTDTRPMGAESKLRICDQCSQPVEPGNSARRLDVLMSKGSAWGNKDRHLLPVKGKNHCDGSPSRAQYLPGQPRDRRNGATYFERNERPYREAHAKMLAEAKEGAAVT